MALRAFATSAAAVNRRSDGGALLELLSPNNAQVQQAAFGCQSTVKQLVALIEERLGGIEPSAKWAKFLAHHLASLRGRQQGNSQARLEGLKVGEWRGQGFQGSGVGEWRGVKAEVRRAGDCRGQVQCGWCGDGG